MRSTITTLFAAAALSAYAQAQHLIGYDPPPFGPGLMFELQLAPVFFPALPPAPVYPIVPILPPPPAIVPLPGDSTFHSVTTLNWFTNGAILASMPTPTYPPAGPIIPPFPIAPAVLAAIGGAATGIAINSATGVMFLVGAPGIVIGVFPVPGTPVAVPPFPIPFATGPITGLEWDGISGTLLACDVASIVYRFFVGGPPFAPPYIPAVPMPAPAGDVAIDKTGLLNVAGFRAIYVVAGPLAIDVTLPPGPGVPFPTGMVAPSGVSFLARPAVNLPASCPCGPLAPIHGTTSPMVSGNGAFGLTVSGLPPGTFVLHAIDFAYNPALPLINLVGCGLGLVGTPAMMLNFAFADPFGVATWGLPLFLPPGLGPAYAQALYPCTVDPTGWALTNVQHLAVCGL